MVVAELQGSWTPSPLLLCWAGGGPPGFARALSLLMLLGAFPGNAEVRREV